MQLTKHHGLENDFLVLLDLQDRERVDEAVVRDVCDRHRGIGADGFIRVVRGLTNPFRMELWNEDGTRAEMSGNGISCMAQAVLLAGVVPTTALPGVPVSSPASNGTVVRVDTDAGERVVTVERLDVDRHRARVAMGTPKLTAALDEWEDEAILRAVQVDVGNPHVVCHVPDPASAPDLVAFGEMVNASTPGGTNVEFVSPGPDGSIVMSVYERGVGLTRACGTGAVAAATAAHEWGLSPSTVRVTQPGGDADVELGDPAHLTVPVVAVGRIVWPWR